jgi:hypothetical protein
VLAQAIKILGWDQAVSTADDGPLHAAENALIAYISESVPHSWFQIYDRSQLQALLSAIEELLGAYGLNYIPLRREDLCELVKRLAQERPPISQAVDAEGMPENRDIDGSHCLYAGWSYWFGRAALTEEARSHDTQVLELTFLCDQALLQQRAIQLVNEVYR